MVGTSSDDVSVFAMAVVEAVLAPPRRFNLARQVSAGSPFHAGSCGEMEATTRAINTPREPNSLRSVAAMDPCKHHLQCFSASPITTSHST